MRLERLAVRLESERLVLRCFEPTDVGALFDAVSESREHLERWLAWPNRLVSVADVEAWVHDVAPARYDATRAFGLGLFTKTEGRLVGAAGLKLRSFDIAPDAWRWVDVGYWLHARATKRGYAREAVRRLTRHAFEDLAAERVEIRVETGNLESIAVAERSGFRREGVLRRTLLRAGTPRDMAVYSMLPEERDALEPRPASAED